MIRKKIKWGNGNSALYRVVREDPSDQGIPYERPKERPCNLQFCKQRERTSAEGVQQAHALLFGE